MRKRRNLSDPNQSPELTLATVQVTTVSPLGASELDDSHHAEFIYKENVLAKAIYVLSPRAQMFVFYAITLIQPDDQNLSRLYKIEAKDLAEWAKLDLESLRRDLWDQREAGQIPIGKELLRRWMIIPDHYHAERGIVTDLGCHWFSSIIPSSSTGACDYLDVRFTPDLVPYLVNLRTNYYKARRVFIIKLDSRYAMRLYEWIESERYRLVSRKGRLTVSLDDLRGYLGTDEPIRDSKSAGKKDKDDGEREQFMRNGTLFERKLASFHHFRDRALNVAVKQINEHTDLNVTATPLRGGSKGRGVHTIEFEITPKVAGDMVLPASGTAGAGEPNQMMLDYAPGVERAKVVPSPGQPAPAALQQPPADAKTSEVEISHGSDLERFLGTLAMKYKLSLRQREGIPDTARGHGYETPEQIIDWLHALDTAVCNNRRSENASRDFCAAVKNNYAQGVPAHKLAPSRHPAKREPLSAPVVTPGSENTHPADPSVIAEEFQEFKGVKGRIKNIPDPKTVRQSIRESLEGMKGSGSREKRPENP